MFQEFLDECEQACRGVHDREFEPTEASGISGPSVSDGSDNDDVCGRNATETSRNIKNVIDGAGVGLDDHGQSGYARNKRFHGFFRHL